MPAPPAIDEHFSSAAGHSLAKAPFKLGPPKSFSPGTVRLRVESLWGSETKLKKNNREGGCECARGGREFRGQIYDVVN